MNKLQCTELDEGQSRHRLTGAQNTKEELKYFSCLPNRAQTVWEDPGLEGSSAPAQAGVDPGWSRAALSFPFPGESRRAEGLWLTAPSSCYV